MNTFHWHLTDDQGWRIEIKKYPKLCQIGARRDSTQLNGWKGNSFDGKVHEGYYTSKEIQKMYIHATTIVIMISTLLSFGITTWILSYAFKIVFEEYAGWLPFYVEGSVYIKMFIMTVISYLFVMMIQMRKIKKIPMDEALKNVE